MTGDEVLEAYYEIRLQGHLDAQRFTGLSVRLLPNGETLLSGPVVDQAALHGILARIRDLGIVLLEVKRTTTS